MNKIMKYEDKMNLKPDPKHGSRIRCFEQEKVC